MVLGGNIYQNILVKYGFIFLLFSVGFNMFLRGIARKTKGKSTKTHIMHMVPGYIFMTFAVSVLAYFMLNSNSIEDLHKFLFLLIIIYFISINVLNCWWITVFLINFPSFLVSHYALFINKSYKEISEYKTLLICTSFGFLMASFLAYLADRRSRNYFKIHEDLYTEKEKIDDFFNLIPVSVIKINSRTGKKELNPKAQKLFQKYECSFDSFSRNAVAKNSIKNKLWQGITTYIGMMNKQNLRRKQSDEDFVAIQDYNYTYSNGLKRKNVEFELQFTQRKSHPEHILIIIEEKGQKAKLKEEKMANMYKNELIKGISHDLKTPLNGIITLLDEVPSNERKNNNYDIMNMSAQFLLLKVNDMLDYSQIETGLFILTEVPFNVRKLFKSIINLCTPQATLDGVHLKVKIDNNLTEEIIGDESRIERILVHLLQNAIKYTNKGGEICLYAEIVKQGLRLGVQNTGSGIDKETKRKIFHILKLEDDLEEKEEEKMCIMGELERMESNSFPMVMEKSVGQETREEISMQGFGLQITSKIVNAMASQLKLSANIGEPTEFFFILKCCFKFQSPALRPLLSSSHLSPLVTGKSPGTKRTFKSVSDNILLTFPDIGEEMEQTVEITQKMQKYTKTHSFLPDLILPRKTSSSFFPKRALIAEDNGVNRLVLNKLLRAENIYVLEANDGLEAVQVVKNQLLSKNRRKNPNILDYIFMDLNMPNLSGMEATQQIRGILSKAKIEVPIFALTAYDTDQTKKECLENGFDEFLVKPIKKNILQKVLVQYSDIMD